MKYGYVYKTTNLLNGKIYVGQHNKSVFDTKYYGSGKRILSDIKKLGIENFEVEVLQWCNTPKELNETEEYFILFLRSFDSEIGYNISTSQAGDITYGMNDEEYFDFSEKNSGELNGMFKSGERGIHPRGMLGKHHTSLSREKIGMGVSGSSNGFFGKSWDDYGGHPKGMLGKRHKKTTSWKHQVGFSITHPNGEIETYTKVSDAVRILNVPRSFIQTRIDNGGVFETFNKRFPYQERFVGCIFTKI